MWRPLVAFLGTIVAATGGVTTPVRDTRARLAIETSTGAVTSVLVPSEATLECDHEVRATGFLHRAAKPACSLIRRGTVTELAARHRSARLCVDAFGGPQSAHITGTVGGRRVDMTINRGDGCGIDEWDQLRALLGDPERRGAIPRPNRSTATTTTTSPPVMYRVQRGDTLTEIAKQFHTSVAAIVTTNGLSDADQLTEGQDLVMPPPSEVRIAAELIDERTDAGFDLTLTGATPSEVVTFVITLPDGSTYTGSAHVASGSGVVTTTYNAAIGSGTYTVTAKGERGTNAESRFHVDPPG